MDRVQLRDLGAHEHVAVIDVGKIGSNQDVQVSWTAEGAAALCGGGEPKQVGDRSRADRCGPVPADVGIGSGVGAKGGIGRRPRKRHDDCPLGSGAADRNGGNARGRRRSHNRRTIAVVPGRCRCLSHGQVISDNVRQRQYDRTGSRKVPIARVCCRNTRAMRCLVGARRALRRVGSGSCSQGTMTRRADPVLRVISVLFAFVVGGCSPVVQEAVAEGRVSTTMARSSEEPVWW